MARTVQGVPLLLLLGLAMLTGACTAGTPAESPTIAGTYNCGPEGGDPVDVVELGTDGSFTVDGNAVGTWRVEGDGGVIDQSFGEDDPFTIEGVNLVFARPGAPERWVCTPAD